MTPNRMYSTRYRSIMPIFDACGRRISKLKGVNGLVGLLVIMLAFAAQSYADAVPLASILFDPSGFRTPFTPPPTGVGIALGYGDIPKFAFTAPCIACGFVLGF